MTKEVENIVQQSAVNYRKMLAENSGNNHATSDFDFRQGAEWALSHPELMREEIEKIFVWTADNIGSPNNPDNRPEIIKYILDKYFEHLRQQP